MSINIWHKAEQKPRGDEWEIYYINAYNNVHRYSAEEMQYDEVDWQMAVKCCAMLRWAYKDSFLESTFNYSRSNEKN
ncbi:MAG: hypothetical protein ACI4TK_17855 [Agathobacter sp.]